MFIGCDSLVFLLILYWCFMWIRVKFFVVFKVRRWMFGGSLCLRLLCSELYRFVYFLKLRLFGVKVSMGFNNSFFLSLWCRVVEDWGGVRMMYSLLWIIKFFFEILVLFSGLLIFFLLFINSCLWSMIFIELLVRFDLFSEWLVRIVSCLLLFLMYIWLFMG